MKTGSQRTCLTCGNEFSAVKVFCPVCVLRGAAERIESAEASFEEAVAATFLALDYQVINTSPELAVYSFVRVQFTGVLGDSGNEMRLTALVTVFNPDGTQNGDSIVDAANGVRIPLEILPNTSHRLTIPVTPPR
jgi:hypothetical protein